MSDADKRFHEQWIGMVQPSEGLVVSLPVLVDAQCAEKQPRELHQAFLACLEEDATGRLRVGGSFRADNVEAFVRLLEASFGVTTARLADGSLVLRRAK